MLSKMLTRAQMALLCLGLFLALALCGAWQAFTWGRTQLDTGALVCADTLRLHIRPENDSIASQSAKLHVRDAVLAYLDAACPAKSKPDALCWAARHLFELQLTARHALAGLNIRTPVRVQLVNMYFDTRRYASVILPAGRYDALRIQIGAGTGRNWWCAVSYTHLRAHETDSYLVCRLLLEKKKSSLQLEKKKIDGPCWVIKCI